MCKPATSRTPVAELDDSERLLASCSGDSLEDARDLAIISLLRATGMRRGELIATEWPDIDVGENTITLRTDTIRYSTLFAVRTLGRRVAALDAELVELKAVARPLIDRTAPGLLSMYGVGYDAAAKLLIAAGDNPDRAPLRGRLRSPVRCRTTRGVIGQDRPAPPARM